MLLNDEWLKCLWRFSGAHMRQSLRLSSKCEEHFFKSSLNHTSRRFLSLMKISSFHGTRKNNKLTNSHLSGFIVQSSRTLRLRRRRQGLEAYWRHWPQVFQVHTCDNCWDRPARAKIISTIDLFCLYILFSQYKSCDNTQEDWSFVLLIKKSACKHEYACMHSF